MKERPPSIEEVLCRMRRRLLLVEHWIDTRDQTDWTHEEMDAAATEVIRDCRWELGGVLAALPSPTFNLPVKGTS